MPISVARAQRVVRRAGFDVNLLGDPRQARGRRYGLEGLIRLLVLGFVCGKVSLREVEETCERLQPGLRRRLGLRSNVSDTALYELLSRLDPTGFREMLWEQLRGDLGSKLVTNDLFPVGVLSMDGKGAGGGLGEAPHPSCRQTTCDAQGTPTWNLFTVRASLTSSSACPIVDQECMTLRDGEATLFPRLFERAVKAFPRLFEVVTYDAGGTSRANAQLVLDHKKTYMFALKASYGVLFPAAAALLSAQQPTAETRERADGAEIVRQLRRVAAPAGFNFPGARQLWSVTQIRIAASGAIEREERLFVTSLDPQRFNPDQILRLIRMHWRIENNANWTFDMVLKEDTRAPCEAGAGVVVVSWLRVLAFNILSAFRAHLPRKDKQRRSWSYCCQLVGDALAIVGVLSESQPMLA